MTEPLNAQKIFEKVAIHLLKQGKRSILRPDANLPTRSYCAYRGKGSTKCAAGALILDEHYLPTLELQSAEMPDVQAALLSSGIPTEQSGMVMGLQGIHDNTSPITWKSKLRAYAENHNLNFTPVEEAMKEHRDALEAN